MTERVVTARSAVDLDAVLGPFLRGAGDPSTRRDASGRWWLARRTPDGPGTLALQARPAEGAVLAQAWGPGAGWLLDSVPDLLGEGDDDTTFVAHHDLVARGRASHPGWRVPRSRLVLEALVPAIIEQRVTGREAFASFRMLVRQFGEPAPGPAGQDHLMVGPDPRGWAHIPSWAWLKAGVERQRSATVVAAAGRAGRIEECVDLSLEAATARLMALPGVGVWTAAEVAHRALGDADAVSFGDYHVARNTTYALTGEVGDDAALAALLEPYAGHRYRAQRYIAFSGITVPRRGPRRSLPTHLPTRW
ncbi:DNA-3-methyladenine glycosylase family protein [Janibacter sp. G1551]|uniref:DNA-3-methyladenine glycosylase family protein n=1 Tax=Janibacter sp. G1551 TaxID=3420440 RepID=UPI003D012287